MKLWYKKVTVYKGVDIFINQDAEYIAACKNKAFYALTLKGIKALINEILKEQ